MDNELFNAKLDLIRQEQTAGFAKLEAALDTHIDNAKKIAEQVSELEDRLRAIEVESAKSQVKLQLVMAIIGLSSGGISALLTSMF